MFYKYQYLEFFLLFSSIAATNTDRKSNLGFRDKPQRENKIVFAGNKHIGTWRTWCGLGLGDKTIMICIAIDT